MIVNKKFFVIIIYPITYFYSYSVSIKQRIKFSFKISYCFRTFEVYVWFNVADDITYFFDLFDYDRCDRSKPTAPRRFRVETRSSRENREGNRSIGKALLDSARCCWYGSSRARIARLHANRIADRSVFHIALQVVQDARRLPSYWCITDHVEKEYKLDKPLLVRHTLLWQFSL